MERSGRSVRACTEHSMHSGGGPDDGGGQHGEAHAGISTSSVRVYLCQERFQQGSSRIDKAQGKITRSGRGVERQWQWEQAMAAHRSSCSCGSRCPAHGAVDVLHIVVELLVCKGGWQREGSGRAMPQRACSWQQNTLPLLGEDNMLVLRWVSA